jgi:DNA-binding transcriptional ArsR family regulator
VVGVAEDLVVWLWTHTVESDWARRERILRADIVARTAQLARHGWGTVLRDLGRDREWVGDGQLRINRYDLPPHDIEEGSSLLFVPSHAAGTWVGRHDGRYALYYPVSGRLARVDADSTAGLAPLVGANRAELLTLLDVPRSTSQLVALSGQALGSVGGHLKVLLEAGVVLRRRSGREVLYWRTALGDGLVAAGG